MKRAWMAKAAAIITTATLMPLPSYAWGIDYQDTYLNIRGLYSDKQPGYAGNVQEIAGNISYANGWTYGSNFVSLDFEDFSHKGDPANSVTNHADSNSFEVYSVFRTTLSGNKIFGGNMFSFGPIRDVGLELGLDLDTQDDQFASYKKLILVGPQFSINIPTGFWTITTGFSHEWNTDAYLANGNGTNFENHVGNRKPPGPTPFALGPVPLNFTGFANFIGPKGKGRHRRLLSPRRDLDPSEAAGRRWRIARIPAQEDRGRHRLRDTGTTSSATSTSTCQEPEQDAFFVELGYHF